MTDEIIQRVGEALGTTTVAGLIIRHWVRTKFGELAALVKRVPRDIAWKIAARRQLRDQTREINQLKKDMVSLRNYCLLLSKEVRKLGGSTRTRLSIPDIPDIHELPMADVEDEDLKVSRADEELASNAPSQSESL